MNATSRKRVLTILLVLLILGILAGLAVRPTAASITDSKQVTVTNVVDGDTLDVEYSNGSMDTVRLLGVDTPESYDWNRGSAVWNNDGDTVFVSTDSGGRATSRVY